MDPLPSDLQVAARNVSTACLIGSELAKVPFSHLLSHNQAMIHYAFGVANNVTAVTARHWRHPSAALNGYNKQRSGQGLVLSALIYACALIMSGLLARCNTLNQRLFTTVDVDALAEAGRVT